MFKHAVFTLLKEFSPSEIKQLESFLKSPYHNKSKKVKKLFDEIKKFYPDFESTNLSKKKLALKVNPFLKYNDSTLRDLISDLLGQIEEFLILEELNKNYPDKLFLLLKSFTEKNQDILFKKNLRKIANQLESGGIDSVYYYNKSLICMNKLNFNIINKHQKSAKIIQSNEDIRISYMISIIIFSITELINTYVKIIITESKYNLVKKNNTALPIIKGIDLDYITSVLQNTKDDFFILEIYSNLYKAFQNLNSDKHLKMYKSSFFKNLKYLSGDEISFHYSMLISFCILSNSLAESKNYYDLELLKIYESFLKGKFFYDKKTKNINEELYRNILLLALRLEKFNWVFNFISVYSKYLHPNKKGNLLKLSYAEYYYYVGSFKKSLKILNKSFSYIKEIQEESFILKYDIKSLYLMLYYDLKYDDSVIVQINNYRKFLDRNKLVTKDRKERINKFLNIFEKLVYLREGDPHINKSDLNFEVEDLKDINYRHWLLRKIEEIKH